ncbi:hypothetical protein M408DRAFT_12759 [Serendipita vermifera MAFF 305830]|uniref:Uncharacterized protein n=1 Tax=Serendipita vermifera MAFF 305830 TaxID=933852 RepID=A0A0C3AM00_SERVB|nr:hypothetical protein M408DRAFT_12759 [Serendipita vermifera MAFF 305830]
MANISPIDTINLATFHKAIASIAKVKKILDDYRAKDEKLVESQEQLRRQLHEVDTQREKLKLEVIAAESSKQVLQTAAENLRSLCPPIRYLPTEILLYIFQLSVGKGPDLSKQGVGVIAFDRTPIVISQVCSRWRSLVHECKDLWNNVIIDLQKSRILEPSCIDKEELRVATWKLRGDREAQSVFISKWDIKDTGEHLESILGYGLSLWKAIHINLLGIRVEGVFGNYFGICAEEVTVYQHSAARNLAYFMPLMQNATTLTVYGPIALGSTPWSSLRSLSIRSVLGTPVRYHGFSGTDFRDLLQAAPALINLELDFAASNPGGVQHVANEVQHQSLCYLALRMAYFADGPGPFGVRLVVPSFNTLRILSVDLPRNNNTTPPVFGMEYTKKLSLCRLKPADLSHTLALIRQLPNLEDVELEGPHVNDVFININSAYSTTPSPDAVFPFSKVTKLLMDGTDIKGRALIEHLELRLKLIAMGVVGVYPVTEVKLYENKGVTPGDWTRINVLLDKGRKVMVA